MINSTLIQKPIQLPLAVDPIPARRQLLEIRYLMQALDLHEDEIVNNLIPRGLLRFAWDIGLGERRKEIRIWKHSFFEYSKRDYSYLTKERPELRSVVSSILPKPTVKRLPGKTYRTIRGVELAARFTCSSTHIIRLIKAGLLQRCPITQAPKESPYVAYDSAVEFLMKTEFSKQGNR